MAPARLALEPVFVAVDPLNLELLPWARCDPAGGSSQVEQVSLAGNRCSHRCKISPRFHLVILLPEQASFPDGGIISLWQFAPNYVKPIRRNMSVNRGSERTLSKIGSIPSPNFGLSGPHSPCAAS